MLVTPEVAADIARIIREHTVAAAAAIYGPDAVESAAVELAKELGLIEDVDDFKAVFEGLHEFGAFLAHLDQSQRERRYGMTLESFRREIERNPVPRTRQEAISAEFNARYGAQHITALGDRTGASAATTALEVDRESESRLRTLMRDAVSASLGDDEAQERLRQAGVSRGLSDTFFDNAFRNTAREIASDIGHATGMWSRDLQRIATTEFTAAVNEGVAGSFEVQEREDAEHQDRPIRRILAYKLPRPDACKHCIRLHLDGGVPRLYWMDEIRGNGTNVGRKTAEWKVVVGPIHPWCACSLHRVPFVLIPKVQRVKGWSSGKASPTVIGVGGLIVGV